VKEHLATCGLKVMAMIYAASGVASLEGETTSIGSPPTPKAVSKKLASRAAAWIRARAKAGTVPFDASLA